MMRNSERAFIYLGIVAALAIGLGWRAEQPAIAQGSGAPQSAAMRVATVDILTLVEKMIVTERYETAREQQAAEQNKKVEPLLAELQKMQEQAKDMSAESPDFDKLQMSFMEKQQQFQMAQQDAQLSIERLNTDQVGEAYRLAVEAARALASKEGYTHVVASRSGPLSIRSDNVPGAVQEILARPLIDGPAADDLTARLITQLGLEGVKADAPAAPADPSPASKQ